MTNRRRLPNRRASRTFEIEAQGLHFTATISRYDDGRIGEVFLQNHKLQSGAGILASDGAVAASLALQFGCPVETLRRALMRDSHGNSTGPLGVALDKIAERLR
jgi:ribonucleoside-diphosphate reductase alpha chain